MAAILLGLGGLYRDYRRAGNPGAPFWRRRITAIGANCFNMALVLPFAGYYIYKAVSYKASPDSKEELSPRA